MRALALLSAGACVALARSPSFLILLTDDQDVALDGLIDMPTTLSLLRDGGMTFPNAFVTTPICCPSRTSTLSGRYGHNLEENKLRDWCGDYVKAEMNESWVTKLHDAGYRTAMHGKYLNAPPSGYKPDGWDSWFSLGAECQYFNNTFSVNGTNKRFGDTPDDYMTSLIGNVSMSFLQNAIAADAPFLAYIAPHASHMPTTPAPWYADTPLPSMRAPRTPAYNASGEDKHWVIAELPPLTNEFEAGIDEIYTLRHRSLLSVDDIVRDVANLLTEAGRMEDTYFLYTSDHGYNLGTFRLSVEKFHFLDNDIRVPFLVRGPGVAAGSTSKRVVANIDIGVTVLDLAGIAPVATDGRSFAGVLLNGGVEGGVTPPRDRAVIEYGSWGTGYVMRGPCPIGCGMCPPRLMQLVDAPSNTYTGLRIVNGTHDLMYAEFRPGPAAAIAHASANWTELYDLAADPYQLVNLAANGGSAPLVAQLSSELWAIANCVGAQCP